MVDHGGLVLLVPSFTICGAGTSIWGLVCQKKDLIDPYSEKEKKQENFDHYVDEDN